ncbi:MAG TPA: Asp-tRNA(Asn)/Glu-tRNA(Gln) amidotransferase subunit GatC [Ignavibacteriaceae bacterium]|nr:Asp-tRNA(Asn)/Glu-tRNA(Gln) amidotransferase subunit GatC [Ignavibacteriaceae bacterium]
MAVSIDDVKYIANLAKLSFNEGELEDLTSEMNQILFYMRTLNEIDTTDVEPLSHPVEGPTRFRDDETKGSVTTEDALKNAPSSNEEFFKVPKVIG